MPSSKTYYITRHGETFASLKNTGYGFRIRSAPIIQAGIPTIERLAEYLKEIPTDYNASSQYNRCRQTAKIITDIAGKQFVFDKRLNEFFFETFWHLENRLRDFLTEMEESKHKSFLICTHGACISGLVMLLTKGDYRAGDLLSYPPPGILIKIKDGKVTQYDFNEKSTAGR